MPGRRILITGIASYLGTELARRLEADPDVEYVAGLDTRRPRVPLESRSRHRVTHESSLSHTNVVPTPA